MSESVRHAVGRGRWIAIAVFTTVAVGAFAVTALTVAIARKVVTPPKRREQDVRVLAYHPESELVTLTASADSVLPGEYSLWFDRGAGHARIGEIVQRNPQSVTRRVLAVDFGDLRRAKRGRIGGWFYLTPDDLGLPYEDVTLATELGPAPAWLIPAAEPSGRVAIQVHGWASARPEALRAVPAFHRAGFDSLIISYRNDGEAPDSPDSRYALGATEWRDVERALAFAIGRGATDVVLMGWSMGGAVVLQTVVRSESAKYVRGLILESPVIDWVGALSHQATVMGIPRRVGAAGLALLGSPLARLLVGVDRPVHFAKLDFIRRSEELGIPILLLHSVDDDFVPPAGSQALARKRPDIVTFEAFHTARHAKLWNYDPARWAEAISNWLMRLE